MAVAVECHSDVGVSQEFLHELGMHAPVQLFVRDRRKVILTEAGRAYPVEARAIFDRVDPARQVVRQAGRGEIGILSFGYEESTLYSGFPDVVHLYRERFPGVVLELRELVTTAQVEALLGGEIDVGLSQEPLISEGLRVETVFEEPLVAALADNHPLAGESEGNKRKKRGTYGFMS